MIRASIIAMALLVASTGAVLAGSYPSPTFQNLTLTGPLNIRNTGTSGQYDAQIGVTGGGSISAQGQLQMKGALSQHLAPDATEQFRVMNQYGATDSIGVMGGTTGLGPVIFAYSATDANVDLNLAASGLTGSVVMYNGDNYLGIFKDAGGLTAAWPVVQNNIAGKPVFYGANGTDTLTHIQLGGASSCAAQAIGTTSVGSSPNIQGGTCGSVAIGRLATVGGTDSIAIGFASAATASGGIAIGVQAYSQGRRGGLYLQPSVLESGNKGLHQRSIFVLQSAVTGAATKRLTSDQQGVTDGMNSIKVIGNLTGSCTLQVSRTDTREQAIWNWPTLGMRITSGVLTNSTGSDLTPTASAIADAGIAGVTPTLTLDTTSSSLNFVVVTTAAGVPYNETVMCDMLEYGL